MASELMWRIGTQMGRRNVLTGTAGLAVAAALGGTGALTGFPATAKADRALREELMKIPGAGNGSPTDADWQKVGELCLGPTKKNVQPGEFKGVQLSFMGLNNQNLHDFLFRGFLKPWEAYTGASIKWIDLAQADYNARLQQAIATGTVDFDMLEMGAPFEGDVCGKGLASAMPDWVKTQIDFDDYVNYLKPPVGAWDGKIYRVCIDSDCHTINYRTDYFGDAGLAKAWKTEGHKGDWGVPKTWQQVQEVTKFMKGKKVAGKDVYGYLDAPKPWGGFCFYFLASRATAYVKHPNEKAWLFDVDTMKPRVNNPGWVRAIQDVVDALPYEPADQINADPNTTAFQQFLVGTGGLLAWWGDVGTVAVTSDTATVGKQILFDILPASDDVYNHQAGKWETLPTGPNAAPNMAYLGWGIYVMKTVDSDEKKHKAAWSAAALLGDRDLSMWTAAYPSGFQPYRQSHFDVPLWVAGGYDAAYIKSYLELAGDIVQSPEQRHRAAHPRHLPVLQPGRGRTEQGVRGQADRPAGCRQRCRRLGKTDRQDRPRQADCALQSLARHVEGRSRRTVW